MAVKSKKDSYKEKVNRNSFCQRIKYSNTQRLKNVKIIKKGGNIRFVQNRILVGKGKYKKPLKSKSGKVKLNKQENSRIRTHTLIGNASSNVKNELRGKDDSKQPDTGIQAIIYASDKVDAVADVAYSSKRFIHVVKGTKKIVNAVKEKGGVDRRVLLKQLAVKGTKSGLRTAKNINTQVSIQFQSEDTDLGIRSFAETEKEVRRTYDTAIALKYTSSDISNVIKTVNSRGVKSNECIKTKIYNEKIKRYNGYKQNTQKYEKIKSGQKVRTSAGSKTAAYRPNRIKTNKTIINRTLNHRRTVVPSKITKNIIEVAKKAVTIILPGKKTLLFLIVGAAAFFLFVNSVSSSLIASLSQQYFMTDNDVAENYRDKVELLDGKLLQKINDLADDDSYDDVRIDYIGDMLGVHTNFQEIFAVAAVKFEQDLTFSTREESFIEKIYKELYEIKVSSEVYYVPSDEDDDKEKKQRRKIITVYTSDMDTIMNEMKFDEEQKAWARRLVSGFNEQFPEFAQQYGELTQEEIIKLRENAPNMSNVQQKKLYDTALSIVGKVKYFWGGKSSAGWNDDWGESTKVTAKGSDTTDTYRPFGLDCSGYVDWVYKTAGIGNMLSGGGTAYQFKNSYPIREDELQVGDLAFLQMPNSSGINHVGIYIGKDKDENNLYAHSEWGTGVTVNSFNGFKYFRRVVNFEQE